MCQHIFRHKNRIPRFVKRWMLLRASKKLKLDSAQQVKLQALYANWESSCGTITDARKLWLQSWQDGLLQSDLDKTRLLELLQIPESTVRDILPSLLDEFAEFMLELSQEQRSRFVDWVGSDSYPGHGCRAV